MNRLLEKVQKRDRSLKEAYEDEIKNRQEDTRSKVTLRVITIYTAFILSILACSAYIIIKAPLNDIDKLLSSLKEIIESLNTVLLPVVTLVLGFYFGSQKN